MGSLGRKFLAKFISYTRTTLSFPLNIFLPFLLFVGIFLSANWFQQYYLVESASESILKYIFGFWSGAFPIAIAVYLGYMRDKKYTKDEERIFTTKSSASIIAGSLMISSARLIPDLSGKIGLTISKVFVSDIVLNLVYLLPATLVFTLFRSIAFSSGISIPEEKMEELRNFDAEEDESGELPEIFSEINLLPDFGEGLQEGEITDVLVNGNLMILAFGFSTYIVENFLIQLSLLQLFFMFYIMWLVSQAISSLEASLNPTSSSDE